VSLIHKNKEKSVEGHIKFVLGTASLLYPLAVFLCIVVFKVSARYLSIFIIVFAVFYFIINGRNYYRENKEKKGKITAAIFISPAILCVIGAVCLLTSSPTVLKMYPALADAAYLTIFTTSLFMPPPLVSHFITIIDKKIKERIAKEKFDVYCRQATIVWCVFFFIDGLIALWTVFWVSDFAWGVYNGGVTYAVMALIFAGDYIILKIIAGKTPVKIENTGGKNDS
jgi:uncharacterized membrane protein